MSGGRSEQWDESAPMRLRHKYTPSREPRNRMLSLVRMRQHVCAKGYIRTHGHLRLWLTVLIA